MKHIHIPLEGANKPLLENKKIQTRLKADLKKTFNYLVSNEEKALVHCAAGIHRTGITAYTFLRWTGLSQDEAIATIKGMREDTHKGVGDWRIQLAEDNLV